MTQEFFPTPSAAWYVDSRTVLQPTGNRLVSDYAGWLCADWPVSVTGLAPVKSLEREQELRRAG